MTSTKKRSFFLKNGKQLKNVLHNCFVKQDEAITTLFDISAEPISVSVKNNLKTKTLHTLLKVSKQIKPVHAWAISSFVLFSAISLMFLLVPWTTRPIQQDKYSIYASTPLTLKDMSYSIYTRDSRAQKINAVFKEYKCPLEGLGEVFVYEADKYNIPWWLVAAVSFQESTCGKKTPEPTGLESYNAWGWGVYGDNVQSFDNWVRGIETVSEYMSDRFYSKGVSEPCDIMKTYTPPSQGSWCEGVKFFGDQIQNYTSDESVI